MSDLRWLDGSRDPVEGTLREALDDARQRVDEMALRRIWAKVAYVEPERRRPRWFAFAGGVATSAVLTAGLLLGLANRQTAVISPPPPAEAVARRQLEVLPTTPSATDLQPAPPTADSPAPRLFRTGRGETLRLSLGHGIEAQLGARSALNVSGEQRPLLERGEVLFEVPRQPPGQTFSVDVGPYRIVVLGTRFQLRHDRGRIDVDVQEGTVDVWRERRLARLTAGESWSGPAGVAAATKPPASAKGPPLRDGPATAVAYVAPTSGATSRTASATTPALPPSGTGDALPSRAAEAASSSATPMPSNGAVPARAPTLEPSETAQQARGALASGDVHRALELYKAVRMSGGPAAENAEYELGMIYRDRLKRPGKAIATWRRYRAEHPQGLLRLEADVSIIDTLVRNGDNDAALAEAQDFLGRHGSSERRAEIANVAGDLYRAAGECAPAVKAYDLALASPRAGTIADAATFHRGLCMMSLDQNEGRAGLQVYLRDFANGRYRERAQRLLQGNDTRSP